MIVESVKGTRCPALIQIDMKGKDNRMCGTMNSPPPKRSPKRRRIGGDGRQRRAREPESEKRPEKARGRTRAGRKEERRNVVRVRLGGARQSQSHTQAPPVFGSMAAPT